MTSPPVLPASLSDVSQRTRMVEGINQELKGRTLILMPYPEQQQFRSRICAISEQIITEPLDNESRISIGLRLWAGCIDGAKTIAARTSDGPNTRESRAQGAASIAILGANDPIYVAGAEAAPEWKRLIGQGNDVFFDGVQADSPLRRYP